MDSVVVNSEPVITFTPAAVSSEPRPARKIAILGFGRTVKDCPWQDPSWELIGMNGFWRAAKPDFGIDVPEDRYALWFDMHSLEYTRAYGIKAGFGDAQERWLEKEHPFPVFMLEANPAFPSVLAFPIEELVDKLGRDYFTSSVSYEIAYALCLPDIAEIGLWGIDLTHDTEYADQRPCAEYWIGRAEAMGIKVTVHEQSAMLKQRYRYGYEDANPLARDLRAALTLQSEALTKAMAAHQEEIAQRTNQLHTDDGALQIIREVIGRLDTWGRGGRI
jgi:hypothetical protein